QFTVISTVIIVCYFILKRYFTLSAYSKKVRQMQNKLSNGMIIQVIIHICAIALIGSRRPVVAAYGFIFNADEEKQRHVSGIYIVIVYLVFIWYPVITGLLIRWSISGFLTRRKVSEPASIVTEYVPGRKTPAEERRGPLPVKENSINPQ
ncbi:hypothetical protein NECAME_09393, partial [Necator americanus]